MKNIKYATKENFLGIFPDRPEKMSFWFSILEAAYTQANRYYHNLQHIDELLESIENLGEISSFPVTESIRNNFKIYAWFHDVVCYSRDFTRPNPSALEAAFASSFEIDNKNNKLSFDLLKVFLSDVFGFEPQQGLSEFKGWRNNMLFRDLDYLIFAKPIERVVEYDDQIEREFMHENEENKKLKNYFNSIRFDFLLNTFNDEVFKTEDFRKKYTEVAKKNIEVLIKKYDDRRPFDRCNVPLEHVFFARRWNSKE